MYICYITNLKKQNSDIEFAVINLFNVQLRPQSVENYSPEWRPRPFHLVGLMDGIAQAWMKDMWEILGNDISR